MSDPKKQKTTYQQPRPTNIGIKGIEIYIPGSCVNQRELEKFDGVSEGKYTIGLGQTNMSFVNDREDIYSMCLTVCSRLIKNYGIDTNRIGRLEVGTETLLDKSKSVKSVLMQLFGDNHDIEGIDTVNACYGGTNALFNSLNWIESSSWDGRDAIVVCGDIAIYAKGAARPTGGAGTVALWIGPDAPIVFDSVRGSYMEHVYDFYKPDFTSEYPYVDGHYSLTCYVKAVDHVYRAYSGRPLNVVSLRNQWAPLTMLQSRPATSLSTSITTSSTCQLVNWSPNHTVDFFTTTSVQTHPCSLTLMPTWPLWTTTRVLPIRP